MISKMLFDGGGFLGLTWILCLTYVYIMFLINAFRKNPGFPHIFFSFFYKNTKKRIDLVLKYIDIYIYVYSAFLY